MRSVRSKESMASKRFVTLDNDGVVSWKDDVREYREFQHGIFRHLVGQTQVQASQVCLRSHDKKNSCVIAIFFMHYVPSNHAFI